MADFNDTIFSSRALSPEMSARIAASLRDRDQMGLILAMSGDKALSPAGTQMVNNTSAQRQQAINQEYYRAQAAEASRRTTEDIRHNKASEGLQFENIQATNALKLSMLGTKTDKYMDSRVEKFAKRLDETGISKLGSSFDNVINEILPYIKGGKADIPGLGGASNTNYLGGARNIGNTRAQAVRSAITAFVYDKAFSEGGKALTGTERDAILRALNYQIWNTDDDFIRGLGKVRNTLIAATKRTIAEAGGNDVLEEYLARGGTLPKLDITGIPDTGPEFDTNQGGMENLDVGDNVGYSVIQEGDQ